MNPTIEELSKLNLIADEAGKNASRALSKLTNEEIKVDLFDAKLLPLEALSQTIDHQEMVVAVYLQINGDLKGGMVLIFDEKCALNLVDLLWKKGKDATTHLDEMSTSVIKETGNILAGNYLTAFANHLGMKLLESVPDIILDSPKSIINTIAVELSQNMDEALVSEMQFSLKDKNVDGQMIVFFEAQSAKKITGKLKENNQ